MPTQAPPTPILSPIADFFAEVLRVPGGIIRNGLIDINVTAAKGIFIAYFILLIIWVMTLKKEDVNVTNERNGKVVSLRPYAIAALLSQIIIYLIF